MTPTGQDMTKTEQLYDLLTTAHFNLMLAYDLVPKWLSAEDEPLVTADDLQSLRNITTENALLARDLEGDIDALLNDVSPDPVEAALMRVRDALEMLHSQYDASVLTAPSPIAQNSFCDKRNALEKALDLVDGIIMGTGIDVPRRSVDVPAYLALEVTKPVTCNICGQALGDGATWCSNCFMSGL